MADFRHGTPTFVTEFRHTAELGKQGGDVGFEPGKIGTLGLVLGKRGLVCIVEVEAGGRCDVTTVFAALA
jgi:hypothetical protein